MSRHYNAGQYETGFIRSHGASQLPKAWQCRKTQLRPGRNYHIFYCSPPQILTHTSRNHHPIIKSFIVPPQNLTHTSRNLHPATAPAKTSVFVKRGPTKFLVDSRGHLVNRPKTCSHGMTSSFRPLARSGAPGSTPARWPGKPSQMPSFNYPGSSTMGFKGLPSNTGYSSTVKLPTECFYTTTR